MKLIDAVESISVFQDYSTDSHASVKFPCDIGEGRKAIEKKNVESSPSTLNGAMRDDGW